MKTYILTILGIMSIVSISCQEVITIDLEEGPKRLIVEGRIERDKDNPTGYQSISLSTTADYFINDMIPAVSGAKVTIKDDRGNLYALVESSSDKGRYETNDLFAEVGRVYTITIVYGGETYQGQETLLAVAEIDSIYQQFREENIFDEEGIRITIDYSDPAEEENYYYWEQFRNGSTLITPNPGTKWSLISSDELYNGQTIRGKLPNDEMIFIPGDRAEVRQIALSEFAYKYYFAIFDQEGNRGGLSTPPALIRGNLENLTNPDNFPLGYFYASEISVAALNVK
jgi:hypothetical protein